MRARWVFLAAAWSGMAGPATGAEAWIEARTANFTVVSNAGEGTAQRTAREFEQVRSAYRKLWPGAHLAQGRSTLVLALKNEGTLRRWAPGYFEVKGGIDVAFGSALGPDRQYLLVRTDYRPPEIEVTPNFTLYRAYVGILLQDSFERRLPLWLSIGLGEVLGNTFVRDTEIWVGKPVPWQFRRFNQGSRLPLSAILDARGESPLINKESARALFNAQTYVLVHYLLYGDRGAHAAALSRFLQLWLGGRSQDQAVAESLGSPSALEAKLPSYATQSLFSYARFQVDATIGDEQPALRVLSVAEVCGLQAALHVAMNRPVEAQGAIREAHTADPRSPVAYDAEGLLADRDRDEPRAKGAYAQAVEFGSTSAYSHYRAAQLAWKPKADAAALLGLRQRLERAIELNGDFANAHSFLAEVLLQQGDGQAALASAQRAVELEPASTYHRVALARVLQELGRSDEARRSAELGLQLADDDAERSNAERFLRFVSEEARYAEERTRQETSRKQTSACEGGAAAACEQILPDLERECGENEARVCLYLSWLYSQGTGVPKDATKAVSYLEKACAAGDKPTCVEYAWKLVGGEGVAKDEPRGTATLEKLCDEGVLAACTRLALSQVNRTSAASRARVKALLTRACEGGEADACEFARQFK